MRVLISIIASLILQYQSKAQNPTLLGFITDNATTLIESAVDMAIQGNYPYIATSRSEYSLEVTDITDPSNPTHVAKLEDTSNGTSTSYNGLVVIGDYIYIREIRIRNYKLLISQIQVIP